MSVYGARTRGRTSARRADVVLHLAAAVGVELIVGRPLESVATNIRGSEIVLEKCNKYGRKVLVTSISEIYGKNNSDRLSEEDDRILGSPLKTRWSYSEAKAIEEVLAYSYWREKGLPAVIVRLFNTVDLRQVGFYGMVVPRFVEQALKGQPITVYGDGTQRRSGDQLNLFQPPHRGDLQFPRAHLHRLPQEVEGCEGAQEGHDHLH